MRVKLNFYKVIGLPSEPEADSVYYAIDEDNGVIKSWVTDEDGVAKAVGNAELIHTIVNTALAALLDGVPAAFDTLKEISDKLGEDDDALASLLTLVGTKLTGTAATKEDVAAGTSPTTFISPKALKDSDAYVRTPTVSGKPAAGTITLGANPSDGHSIVDIVPGKTVIFKNAPSGPTDVQIGGSLAATVTNLKTVAETLDEVGAAEVPAPNSVRIELAEKGTVGNTVPLAPGGTASFTTSGETFTGGEDGLEQAKVSTDFALYGDPEPVKNDDTVLVHRITPETVTVAGAGTPEADGDYTKRGLANDRPYYNAVGHPSDPDTGIRWDGSQWAVPAPGVSNNGYRSTDDVANPGLCTTWLANDGIDPVPTVTVAEATHQLVRTSVSKAGAYTGSVDVGNGVDITLSAGDTGKQINLPDEFGRTVTLPDIADCVPGETKFYIFALEPWNLAADPSTFQRVHHLFMNESTGVMGHDEDPTATGIMRGLHEVRCVSDTIWAIPGGPVRSA